MKNWQTQERQDPQKSNTQAKRPLDTIMIYAVSNFRDYLKTIDDVRIF
jgi:hypothetical protein